MKQKSIIYVNTNSDTYKQQEFKELLKACDLETQTVFSQTVKAIDFRTYIGSGKVQEITDYTVDKEIDSIYFDVNLTPLQVRNLEAVFQIPVIDREELILEIFHQRASTKVAKLQIELARLEKILPRLIGSNTQLSRQAGGKNKGTGEKQLELDRRRIKARISECKKELKQVEKERNTQRRQRTKAQLPLAALVGYTNAGKSTLMNALLARSQQPPEKHVLEKDMLFATLDTTVRRISLPQYPDFLLSDTVGFVSDLPHHLVDAFTSTLEEITYADVLIQVVDASDEHCDMHMKTTMQTLQGLQVAHLPMLTIFNKCDRSLYPYPQVHEDRIFISALQHDGVDEVLQRIVQHLFPSWKWYSMRIPYTQHSIFSNIVKTHKVQHLLHHDQGIQFRVLLDEKEADGYQEFMIHDE